MLVCLQLCVCADVCGETGQGVAGPGDIDSNLHGGAGRGSVVVVAAGLS